MKTPMGGTVHATVLKHVERVSVGKKDFKNRVTEIKKESEREKAEGQ